MEPFQKLLKNSRVQILLLIALVFLVYANSLPNDFVSDDITGLKNVAHTWKLPLIDLRATVIHMTTVLWYGVYKFVGLSPWAYRFVNILFHAGVVILLYTIVSRLWNRRIAWWSAALFAVHPILIESVTWIAGGLYAHYSFFFLLSLYFYIRSKTDGRISGIGIDVGRLKVEKKNVSIFYSLLSIFIFLVSLLFSEKAVALSLIFVAYEFSFGNLKKYWRRLIPYFIISTILLVFYLFKINERIAGVALSMGDVKTSSYHNPFLQIPIALTEYFRLVFWPHALTFYHSETQFTYRSYFIRLILIIALGICWIISAFKSRRLFFCGAVILIPLIPTLLPIKVAWIVAERYFYLSATGIIVAVITLFDILLYRKDVKGQWIYSVFIGAVIIGLSVRTISRNRDWYNEDTLWFATVKFSPTSPNIWNNLGDVYARRGDPVNAIKSFEHAIAINPRYGEAYHNLAETYKNIGQMDTAIPLYEKALEMRPDLWQTHVALSAIYFDRKNYEKAAEELEKARLIVPENSVVLYNIEVVKKAQIGR